MALTARECIARLHEKGHEEDETSDFEDENSASSGNGCEYEAPRPNCNSAAEKILTLSKINILRTRYAISHSLVESSV